MVEDTICQDFSRINNRVKMKKTYIVPIVEITTVEPFSVICACATFGNGSTDVMNEDDYRNLFFEE